MISFQIITKTKRKDLDNHASQIKEIFDSDLMKVSNKNYLLTQHDFELYIELTPRKISFISTTQEKERLSNLIRKFLSIYFKGGILGIHSDNSNLDLSWIKTDNLQIINI